MNRALVFAFAMLSMGMGCGTSNKSSPCEAGVSVVDGSCLSNTLSVVSLGECFAGTVQIEPDGSSNCIMIETFPMSSLVAGVMQQSIPPACETIGLCTPGSVGCNRSAQSSFPNLEPVAEAAADITLPITSGSSTVQVAAEMDPTGSGNIVLDPPGGVAQLVCEVPQFVSYDTDLTDCVSDPTWTSTIGGWCYANSDSVLTASACDAGNGVLRVFGTIATPSSNSGLYLDCRVRQSIP
jgi:hypothetical protein